MVDEHRDGPHQRPADGVRTLHEHRQLRQPNSHHGRDRRGGCRTQPLFDGHLGHHRQLHGGTGRDSRGQYGRVHRPVACPRHLQRNRRIHPGSQRRRLRSPVRSLQPQHTAGRSWHHLHLAEHHGRPDRKHLRRIRRQRAVRRHVHHRHHRLQMEHVGLERAAGLQRSADQPGTDHPRRERRAVRLRGDSQPTVHVELLRAARVIVATHRVRQCHPQPGRVQRLPLHLPNQQPPPTLGGNLRAAAIERRHENPADAHGPGHGSVGPHRHNHREVGKRHAERHATLAVVRTTVPRDSMGPSTNADEHRRLRTLHTRLSFGNLSRTAKRNPLLQQHAGVATTVRAMHLLDAGYRDPGPNDADGRASSHHHIQLFLAAAQHDPDRARHSLRSHRALSRADAHLPELACLLRLRRHHHANRGGSGLHHDRDTTEGSRTATRSDLRLRPRQHHHKQR